MTFPILSLYSVYFTLSYPLLYVLIFFQRKDLSLSLSRATGPVNNKKAFTLVELMIVIAIIGVLVASLFPMMSNYMAKARDTEMVAEFKKIQTALISYSSDTGGYPIQKFNTDTEYGTAYSTHPYWLKPLQDAGYYESTIKPSINQDSGPWCWSGLDIQNHIYVYVSNGAHYLLCGWFESPTDGRRLEQNDQKNLVVLSGALGDLQLHPSYPTSWGPYFRNETFKNMGGWSKNLYIVQE